MGDVNVTTQHLRGVKTDPERGLIMIRGAVPGAKGGWVLLRDAVKRALPDAAPKPGAFRKGAGEAANGAQANIAPEAEAGSQEEWKPTSPRSTPRRLERLSFRTMYSGSSRGPTSFTAWCAISSPSGAAAPPTSRIGRKSITRQPRCIARKALAAHDTGARRHRSSRAAERLLAPSRAATPSSYRRRCVRWR